MTENRYSIIIFYLATLLSFVNLIECFFNRSIWVVAYIISWIIFLFISIVNDSYLRKILFIFRINKNLKFIIFIILSLLFYHSTITRLVLIFYLIPFHIQYLMFLPFIILSILITGATYGITYKIYECIYK